MIRIVLSNKIDDTQSIRKKMERIWSMFCRQMAMTSLPWSMVFLSADTDKEVHFTLASKEGPYTLVIPPLLVRGIVENFQTDGLSSHLKMQILGIIFQELSKRMIRIEYLSKTLPKSLAMGIEQKAINIIFQSTNAEVAVLQQDEGPPLKIIQDPSGNKITILFMYSSYRITLDSRNFFTNLLQEGWRFC